MLVYHCKLTLLENTFFASREINDLYLTEPLVGNYALTYALGLAQSPYKNTGEIYYYEHLSSLNEQGIYVTPATIPPNEEAKFSFSQFNSVPDTYWFAMGKNCLVQRPSGHKMVLSSQKVWTRIDKQTGEQKKHEKAVNYPQVGFIKAMRINTVLDFFVISQNDLTIPRYIRLGKFMSKARVNTTIHKNPQIESKQSQFTNFLLNPLDLPTGVEVASYDTYSIHPVPLIRNSFLTCDFFQLSKDLFLPAGMKFGVECLRPQSTK